MSSSRNSGYPRRSGYLREDHDFYVEPRRVVHLLLDVETFEGTVLSIHAAHPARYHRSVWNADLQRAAATLSTVDLARCTICSI